MEIIDHFRHSYLLNLKRGLFLLLAVPGYLLSRQSLVKWVSNATG